MSVPASPARPEWIKTIKVNGTMHTVDTSKESVYRYLVRLFGTDGADHIMRQREVRAWDLPGAAAGGQS